MKKRKFITLKSGVCFEINKCIKVKRSIHNDFIILTVSVVRNSPTMFITSPDIMGKGYIHEETGDPDNVIINCFVKEIQVFSSGTINDRNLSYNSNHKIDFYITFYIKNNDFDWVEFQVDLVNNKINRFELMEIE